MHQTGAPAIDGSPQGFETDAQGCTSRANTQSSRTGPRHAGEGVACGRAVVGEHDWSSGFRHPAFNGVGQRAGLVPEDSRGLAAGDEVDLLLLEEEREE